MAEETYKVVTSLYADTFKEIEDGKGKLKNNTILMGSYVKLISESSGWCKIIAFGIEGWIDTTHLGQKLGFKAYYIDVGQGDAALIEVGGSGTEDGIKILIDGGPNDNLSRYLSKWQYKYYFNKGSKVHIDLMFISHFDKDHYQGLIDIINDEHYTFGTIYHNGIAKFNKAKETFPPNYNTGLGEKYKDNNTSYLKTSFNDIPSLLLLQEKGGMTDLMEKFSFAVANAKEKGRIESFVRADFNTESLDYNFNNQIFQIHFLGPVPNYVKNIPYFNYFSDDSHTINGHSLVLKLVYGNRSFLFGGDLNIPAEDHLLKHYGLANPFEVDVAKSCHHGASEFTIEFMKKVNSLATVVSSGDNESYSHPRADAIGCAGKYSKSNRPIVFSTELARSTNIKTDEIKFGMINLRCDGEKIIMAQMKESSSDGKVWDLYEVQ